MVIQKGYTLNGRLVRPAMVIVSQPAAQNLDEQA
jgi:molecular chaperone GrpE